MYKVALSESYFPAQTDTRYREMTIDAVLREQAERIGDRKALREVLADGTIGREWTYSGLLSDAEKTARALASRHPQGARIAIFAGNCPEWVMLEYGAALAGLTLVTINPSFTPREVKYVLEQSGAEAIYYTPVVRGAELKPIVKAACQDLPAVTNQIDVTDDDALFAGHDVGELRQTEPRSIVQIQYTSGTTGFPKGVLLHQQGLLQSNFDVFHRLGIEAGDGFVCPFPLFHTAGSAVSVLGCLTMGATLILVSAFDPAAIVGVIERERPKVLGGVPTMLIAIIEAARTMGADCSSIKTSVGGGALMAPELIRGGKQVFGAPTLIVYGQTESSPVITQTWASDSENDLTGTIGQPLPHLEVSIRDTGDNSVCAIGAQGEICVRGYSVMQGYNDNPEATAAAIDKDGWLHTGDLGTMDERGYCRITGRVKEMIIRGGENLFPAEIEAAMLEHPMVAEVAVAGVPDDKWGEIVACFMRAAPGEKPSADELKAFIRERLSPQKTPAHWIWVEKWPLTGSGKIQKFALSEAFVRGEYEGCEA
ncbi:MAG: AMP-binding protein [Pseudomonadota bacterium]